MKQIVARIVVVLAALLGLSEAVLAIPSADLVSFWEAEGDALDSVDANDGTLVGGAAFGAGVSGQAFSLDGDDDAVIIPAALNLELQDFTISAWVRRGDANAAGDGPVQSEGAVLAFGEDGWGLGMWGGGGAATNGALLLTKIGVSNVDSGTLAVADTASFHHVAVSRSGPEVVFYVDGAATGPVVYNEAFLFTSDLGIGVRGDQLNGGSNFLGLIDDVALYARALSAEEIEVIVSGAVCGDGILDTQEDCDDGNTLDGDDCTGECMSAVPEPAQVLLLLTGALVLVTAHRLRIRGVRSVQAARPSVMSSGRR
jgi:cysteine-rich repeat protein